jgi:hypothetical protein
MSEEKEKEKTKQKPPKKYADVTDNDQSYTDICPNMYSSFLAQRSMYASFFCSKSMYVSQKVPKKYVCITKNPKNMDVNHSSACVPSQTLASLYSPVKPAEIFWPFPISRFKIGLGWGSQLAVAWTTKLRPASVGASVLQVAHLVARFGTRTSAGNTCGGVCSTNVS